MVGRRFLLPALMLLALDAAGVIVSGMTAFFLRYYVPLFAPASAPYIPFFLFFFPLSDVVTLACLAYWGGYRFPQRFRLGETLGLAVRAVVAGAVVTLLLIFLLRLGTLRSTRPFLYSRSVLLMTWSFALVWLVAGRVLFGRLLRWLFRRGVFRRRVAVMGTTVSARQFAERLRRETWLGYEVMGYLTATDVEGGGANLGAADVLPYLQSMLALDEVWLALSDDSYQDTLHIIQACRELPITLRMMPRSFEALVSRVRAAEADVQLLEVRDDLLQHLFQTVRRDLNLPVARVAFVGSRGIPATWGGVEKYVQEVSTRLVARGYHVTVYCRPYYMTVQGTFDGVQLCALPAISTKHLDAIVHTALATAHVILHGDDIVHYQAMGPSLLSFVPRLFGKRTVVTVQGLDWRRAKWGRLARRVLKLGEWAAVTFPNRTIVVSETLQRHYQERYGRPTIFVPNGSDPPLPCPPQAIREWGLEKDNYVLFVGRLVPEKGCHTLIEAFRRLDTDKKLVIAGGSSYSDAYVTRLQNMPGAERAIFTGYVYGDALNELYTNAYLHVLPSEIEGRAITLLETLSYGNCVLVSDIPENVEVVQDYGYTFRNRDVGDLARQLQRLLDDPALVTAMRLQVREKKTTALMGWEQVVDETEAVYRSL